MGRRTFGYFNLKQWNRHQQLEGYPNVITILADCLNELEPEWRHASAERWAELIQEARLTCRTRHLDSYSRFRLSDFDRLYLKATEELSSERLPPR